MRYYNFLALVGIALLLDVLLFGLSLSRPNLRLRFSGPAVVLAVSRDAPRQSALAGYSAPAPTARPGVVARTPTPTSTPLPTNTLSPTSNPQPTPPPTDTPMPTATPEPPPQVIASSAAAFTPHNPAVKANIRMALSHYNGALTRVVIAPGGLFSFNAALGHDPERLPWKDVVTEETIEPPAPTMPPDASADQPAEPTTIRKRVRGGGLCDLASRYVMAARPLLPSRAFHFVNHVRSTGIRLDGVPVRDSVSIWAVGGRRGEQDLLITNVTNAWLEFVVERTREKITVRARLWDKLPPG